MKIAESILNALSEPVLLLDESLCAVVANPAFHKTLEISPFALECRPIHQILRCGPLQDTMLTALTSVVIDNVSIDALEIACGGNGGENLTFSMTSRQVHADDVERKLVLVELRNITLQRDTEQRLRDLSNEHARRGTLLEQTNRELEAFAHSASHDLKTPLRFINKLGHLLLKENEETFTEKAKEKLGLIVKCTEEMGKLIEDLLSFSHITGGPMRKQRVDVVRLANRACHDLNEEIDRCGVQVSVQALPPCQADQALLRQVYLNLITNALKFTRTQAHAEIELGSQQIEGKTAYFVRDNGVGFDMKNAETMFLAFHRLLQRPRVEGSGVGLALVKRIVERHGGRIWAVGGPDEGATIYFTMAA